MLTRRQFIATVTALSAAPLVAVAREVTEMLPEPAVGVKRCRWVATPMGNQGPPREGWLRFPIDPKTRLVDCVAEGPWRLMAMDPLIAVGIGERFTISYGAGSNGAVDIELWKCDEPSLESLPADETRWKQADSVSVPNTTDQKVSYDSFGMFTVSRGSLSPVDWNVKPRGIDGTTRTILRTGR